MENARTYLNLSKFYFNHKSNFKFKQEKIIYVFFCSIDLLAQAKTHILNAREILQQLNIEPNPNHLTQNLLGFEVYLFSIKCSIRANEYLSPRDMKTKTKPANKKKLIDDDLVILEEYVENFKHLMSTNDYEEKYIELLAIKFEIIINNFEEFQHHIFEIVNELIGLIEKYPADDHIKRIIDIYLRCGSYLVHFDDNIQEGLDYYKKAVELSEKEEEHNPSDIHKYQLANANFQWGKARVRANRLSGTPSRLFFDINLCLIYR